MKLDDKPLATIKLHPAVIVIVALALASTQQDSWVIPASELLAKLAQQIGKISIGLGVVALLFAYGAMARYRTTINPRKHSSAVVTTGIYRFSRNPIYIGWFLLIFGQGVINRSMSQIAIAVVMILLLHFAVVLNEEKYLADVFGDQYLDYKNKVRRWL